MDFHALHRRDLQALCKRNGVRANMTNVAMADALGALPTVDGIEEYVKQPAAVPAPADKATVAEEEVRREKQGSPLPRGRRVTAKTTEVVKADEGKSQEEEKAEDAPPIIAVRRGAGRRARPAPAAAASAPETAVAEEEKAIGVGRRGASRRARPAPAVATAAAEPVEDKQGIPPPRTCRVTVKSSQPDKVEDEEEKTENLKLEANNEDAPAQGGVRRGPSRRARPAPVVSKPAAKSAVDEEHGSLLPRGCRGTVNVKSSAPIHTEDMPPLGVGRRGVSRRAQPEPAVSAPVAKIAAEATEPDDGEEEDKDDHKLEEKEEDLAAQGVVPRGPSQHTLSAPIEAPATRRRAAASTTEERNGTLETAPIRPTRQRRPTMKAAAAEEMVPQRAIKKTVASNSTLQQGKEQEEPLGTISDAVFVPSLSCDKGCNDPENVVQTKVIGELKQEDKVVAANQDEGPMERNVTLETMQIRPTRPRRRTMKAAAAEEKVPQKVMKKAVARNSTLQQEKEQDELLGAVSDAVFVPKLASVTGCNDPENVEKATDPHNKVQNEVIDDPKQDNDEELVMNEDEMLMEENPMEKATDPHSKVQNGVIDEPKQDNDKELAMNEDEMLMIENATEVAPVTVQECGDRSPLQEQHVDVKHCATPLLSQDDSPILGLVSTADGQAVEEDGTGISDELLEKGVGGEIQDAAEEMELVPVIQMPRASLTTDESIEKSGFTSRAAHNEMESSDEVLHGKNEISEVDSEDGLNCQEKGAVVDCDVLLEPMDETIAFDCSGYISPVAEKGGVETMISQSAETEAVIDDIVTPVTVIDGEVVMEKAEELATKEDVEEKKFYADFVHVHEQMEIVNLLKAEKVSDKLPHSTATTDEDIEENDFQTDFLDVDELKEVADVEKVEMVTDPKIAAIVDEVVQEVDFQTDRANQKELSTEETQQSTDAVVKEDILDDQLETDFVHAVKVPELIGVDGEVDEANKVVTITEEMVTDPLPKSTALVDEDVQEVDCQTDSAEQEKVLSTEETQQSTCTDVKGGIHDDQLEADFVHADKVPEFIGIDGEFDEESKAVAITEEMTECIGSMDERVKEGCFEIGFVHADELKKMVTADSLLEITETEDEDVQNESVFTGDLPRELDIARDSSDNITPALLDDVIKSLSNITIHEPTVSQEKDIPMCKNSSENTAELSCKDSSDKNTDEPLCKIKSESNIAEPVAMEENMGLNVAKKSADLNKLSLGQLRAKLKNKLKRKEAKRVALARVDENICRTNATGQEQVRKLQQYYPGEDASSEL